MFILSGTLINILKPRKAKRKKAKEYGGDFKLQILHENTLRNGEKRADLVELTVSDTSPYKEKLNAPVSVPVAVSVWQGKLSVRAA